MYLHAVRDMFVLRTAWYISFSLLLLLMRFRHALALATIFKTTHTY